MDLEEGVALIADNDHHATEELQQENADRDQISDNSERESETIVDKPEGKGGNESGTIEPSLVSLASEDDSSESNSAPQGHPTAVGS